MMKIFVLVSLLTVPLITGQNNCGDSTINAKDGNLQLDKNDQSLTIKFSKYQECTFSVTGYKKSEFTLTVTNFALVADAGCKKGLVYANAEKDKIDNGPFKVCAGNVEVAPLNSAKQMLYIKIRPTDELDKSPPAEMSVTLNFKSMQAAQCQPITIAMAGPRQTQTYPPDGSSLADSDCNIKVTGYAKKNFKMDIKEINFNEDCKKSFVAAATDQTKLGTDGFKGCGKTPVMNAIQSTSSELFVNIFTGPDPPAPKVTFVFETIFSECGASDIKLTNETQQLVLPDKGEFIDGSECTIKVSGIDGKNFTVTTPNIDFPVKCEDGYVTAAGTMEGLTTSEKKCGNSGITNPIESMSGVLYLQVKIIKIGERKPKVTFEFKSGASKHGQYAFAAILITNLLSVALY